jgi:hypothetical protein
MVRLYTRLREELLWRLDVFALLIGCGIIGLNASGLLLWLGVSEKAARGLGFVFLMTLFWVLAICWMYLSLKRGLQRAETDEGQAERK